MKKVNSAKKAPQLLPWIRNIVFLFLASLFLTACPDPWMIDQETEYKPILMSADDLESSVNFIGNRPLENPGKMYYKDSIVFINEKYKGVHIIDNHDPSNPVKLGFITIPGSLDIAIKGNVLYADNAKDLVAVSLATYTDPVVTQRIKNIFPDLIPPDQGYLPPQYQADNRPENTVIVEWIKIK